MIRAEHLVLLATSEVHADSSLTYPDGGPRQRYQASNDADVGQPVTARPEIRIPLLAAVTVLNVWWEGGFERRRGRVAEARRIAWATHPFRQRQPHRLAVRATRRGAALRLSRRQQAVEYVLKMPPRSYRPPIAVDGLWRANQDRKAALARMCRSGGT